MNTLTLLNNKWESQIYKPHFCGLYICDDTRIEMKKKYIDYTLFYISFSEANITY